MDPPLACTTNLTAWCADVPDSDWTCAYKYKASGSVCRAARGSCEAPATCSGQNETCAANAFRASTVVCRAAAGACDVAER